MCGLIGPSPCCPLWGQREGSGLPLASAAVPGKARPHPRSSLGAEQAGRPAASCGFCLTPCPPSPRRPPASAAGMDTWEVRGPSQGTGDFLFLLSTSLTPFLEVKEGRCLGGALGGPPGKERDSGPQNVSVSLRWE